MHKNATKLRGDRMTIKTAEKTIAIQSHREIHETICNVT